MKKIIYLSILLASGSLVAKAGTAVGDTVITNSKAKPDDIAMYRANVTEKLKVFPLREASPSAIRMYHRYWRDIDLKDPKNQKFNTEGSTLISALLQGIKDNKVVAYDARYTAKNLTGDEFVNPLTYGQLMGQLTDTAIVNIIDKDGNITGTKKVLNDFNDSKVVGYRLKEDVYFNRQNGRVETRIVGIAPIASVTTTSGDTLNTQPVCWLKYAECRNVFATMDISDPDRKLYDVTMDDVFLQREFKGKITKESNPRGLRIKDYLTDPQLQDKEAQRLEDKLARYKRDLWDYSTTEAVQAKDDKTQESSDVSTTKKGTKK